MIKQKDLAYVLISSTIVTAIWIGFTLYHTIVTSTLDETVTFQTTPIAPRFNTGTIERIQARNEIFPTYELEGRPKQAETETTETEAQDIPTVSTTPAEPDPTEPIEEPLPDEEETI